MATIVCCLNAWHAGTIHRQSGIPFYSIRLVADRTGERFLHICIPWWGVVLAYIIGTTTMSVAGRYVAMFLMASGYAGTYITFAFCSLVFEFFFCGRLRAHAGLGLERGPSTSGEAVGSDWNRQRVWEPREFVRSSLCFQPLRVAHRVVHHPLHVGSGHMCGKRLGALTTIHRCS